MATESGSTPPEIQVRKVNRKPGRPPKKKVAEIRVQAYGIVEAPQSSDYIVEMVYDNPVLFKKICTLYKKYMIRELTWEFHPDRIEIKSRDQHKNYTIHTIIYGAILVRYYCKEFISRTILRENLDKIFRAMDKNYSKIAIVFCAEDSRSKMYVVAKNDEVDADRNYTADIVHADFEQQINNERSDADYPVKFQLPSKHFKKLVNDIALGGDMMTIKKEESEPLKISYNNRKHVALTTAYNDSEKIGLVCTLDPHDILSVSIDIKNVKPFSDSNLGDSVNIAVDKYKDFSMCSDVDIKRIKDATGNIVYAPVCKIHITSHIRTC